MTALPPHRLISGSRAPVCPWCDADVSAAPLTLGQVVDVHRCGGLTHAPINLDGTADDDALVAHCPACAKPFAVALQTRAVRFIPVRTEADVRFEALGLGRAP